MSQQATSSASDGLAWLANIALAVASFALIGMVVIEGWQVLARYVFNDSPSWTEPVALLLINTTMMFSAPVGVRNGTHFGFKVLVHRATPKLARLMKLFAHVITAMIGALLAGYGSVMVLDTWPVKLAGAELRQGILYLPLSLGGLLIVIFSVEHVIGELASRRVVVD
jgi:TRAP-type C4-dicarboxylate transport system permease small subunit